MTAHLTQTAIWVGAVFGVALILGVVVAVVDRVATGIERALTESEPPIDDVAERRRVRAEAFAARRQQLQVRR